MPSPSQIIINNALAKMPPTTGYMDATIGTLRESGLSDELLALRGKAPAQNILAGRAPSRSSEPTIIKPEVVTEMKAHLVALRDFYTPMCTEFCEGVRHLKGEDKLEIPNQDLDPVFLAVKKTRPGSMKAESWGAIRKYTATMNRLAREIDHGNSPNEEDLGKFRDFSRRVKNDPELVEDFLLQHSNFADGCANTGGRSVQELKESYESFRKNIDRNTSGGTRLGLRTVAPHFGFFLWKPPLNEVIRELPQFEGLNSAHFYSPIGEYGKAHSWKILTTIEILHNAAFTLFAQKLPNLVKGHEELLAHTARGNESIPTAPLAAFLEGLATLGRSLSFLTMAEHDTNPNVGELMERIVQNNLVSDLAFYASGAILNPLIIDGKYLPGIISEKGDGSLELNPPYVEILKQEKEKARLETIRAKEYEYDARSNTPSAGLGCPVTYGPGIEDLSKLFLDVYRSLDAPPHRKPSFLEGYLMLHLRHPGQVDTMFSFFENCFAPASAASK